MDDEAVEPDQIGAGRHHRRRVDEPEQARGAEEGEPGELRPVPERQRELGEIGQREGRGGDGEGRAPLARHPVPPRRRPREPEERAARRRRRAGEHGGEREREPAREQLAEGQRREHQRDAERVEHGPARRAPGRHGAAELGARRWPRPEVDRERGPDGDRPGEQAAQPAAGERRVGRRAFDRGQELVGGGERRELEPQQGTEAGEPGPGATARSRRGLEVGDHRPRLHSRAGARARTASATAA